MKNVKGLNAMWTVLAFAGAVALSACSTVEQEKDKNRAQQRKGEARVVEPAPRMSEPAPAPVRMSGGCYNPQVAAGYAASSLAFPTGDPATSALLVHEVAPMEVRAKAPYTYEIHVTNCSSGTLQNVVLTSGSYSNFNYQSSEPAGTKDGNNMLWMLGDLGAKQTKVIKVTGTAGATGVSSNCITASYNNSLCAQVKVVEPALVLEKTATPDVLLCDTIKYTYTIKNTGTGCADSVVIKDTFAAGVKGTNGAAGAEFPIGRLCGGDTRTVEVIVKADKTGSFCSDAQASAAGGMTAASGKPCTNVTQPVLALAAACQDRQFIGRDVTYEFTAKNTGNTVSRATVLSNPLPAGTQFVSATDGGVLQGSNIVWNLGDMAANASKSVKAVVKPMGGASTVSVTGTVQGVCAAAATANCQTPVVGVPALLLNGIDDPDPITLGNTTTYTLRVTNQGTAPLTNVQLWCTMDDGMEFVSATSQVGNGAADGKKVSFPNIASLAPGDAKEYKVVVRATKEGQVQFTAESKSNEITRTLIKTETTNFYK